MLAAQYDNGLTVLLLLNFGASFDGFLVSHPHLRQISFFPWSFNDGHRFRFSDPMSSAEFRM
jgi:hypothetical protein